MRAIAKIIKKIYSNHTGKGGGRHGFLLYWVRKETADRRLRLPEEEETVMPSTYAHRRFGANVLDHLPPELGEPLSRNRPLYDIGLHGPDLLFYYHAAKSNPVSALGNAMHERPGREFFDHAHTVVRQAPDREAALAYALGFVCHFALDSTCHPFVEQYTRQSGVTHCEIETEFDNLLMRRDGLDPLKFFTASHIQPTEPNARVIAPFYAEQITPEITLDALKGMISVHKLLQASNPVKRWVVLTGMKVVGKYDGLHGLVANPQPNPQCTESSHRLEELYGRALPLAEKLILDFVEKLDTDAPLDTAFDHTFGEF